MQAAAEHGLVDLKCTFFDDTPHGSLEFIVMVRPCADRAGVVASWAGMATAVERAVPGTVEQELATLRRDLAAAKDEIAAMKVLAGTTHEASAAQDADRVRVIGEAQRSAETARNEAAAYRQSTSWKITAPLRLLVNALRR
jgi:hypothetical protein